MRHALAVILLAACGEPDEPHITRLTVFETQEGVLSGPNWEVEVHMYLAGANGVGGWLGCAGKGTGLARVQDDNVPYRVNAHFIDGSGEVLRLDDVAGRLVVLVGIESDNSNHCPNPIATDDEWETDDDDIYGNSGPIQLSELVDGPIAIPDMGDMRDVELELRR